MKLLTYLILCFFLFLSLQSCKKEFHCPTPTPVNDTIITSSSYYPANNWGTLAYEDKWPQLNDYDMNDLVVSYQYRINKNNKGKVLSLDCNFTIEAVGANYANGFAVQFPFEYNLVKSVSGQKLTKKIITLRSNGTEAGVDNTVIFPFDASENLIGNTNNTTFINVYKDKAKMVSDTAHIVITFVNPMDTASLGIAPFDPFLFTNMHREREIHLAGKTPTAKADMSLFNTYDDNSKNGVTYLSASKLPWALNFPDGNYAYPSDGRALTATYLHFADWAASSGIQYTDWLSNTSSSYRNTANIYR